MYAIYEPIYMKYTKNYTCIVWNNIYSTSFDPCRTLVDIGLIL
jgi:hypothetical protein